MRKIDADALAARITAEKDEAVPNTPYDIGYSNGLTMAYSIVIAAPTIEAEPVKHGRWVAVKDQLPEHCVTVLSYNGCAISTDFYDEAFQCWNSEIAYNHIIHVTHWMPLPEKPNCGAKMDLEADHEAD